MRILSVFILLTSHVLAFSQNLYNESVISIGASSVFFVKDTLINEGTIVNNGDMQVGGSWINHANYDAGQGQITFNSNLPQIINHNDQAFSRLTLSGGGEKLILADITIENELNLTDGILVSQNDARIVISSSAQITGGSDNSHIRGPVYHLGEGSKLFPVGNGLIYLPVELLNVQGDAAEIGVTAIELDGTVLAKSPALKAISTNRYWQIEVLSGSLNNSRIVLPVRNEEIVTSTDGVVVAQAETMADDFESLGQFSFEGSDVAGKVTSDDPVSKALVAVGTIATDQTIVVYNAIAPGDGNPANEVLIIGNIEYFPQNRFTLFNRWGDKVFEIENYDNKERVFRGTSNIGGEKDLTSGTYFYSIETKKDGKKTNGFLVLKR